MEPVHYTKCEPGFMPLDFIEAYNIPFSLGNAFKYLVRCENKGFFDEDLKKALYYLERHIKHGPEYSLPAVSDDRIYMAVVKENKCLIKSLDIREIAYLSITHPAEAHDKLLEYIQNREA